MVFPMCGNRPEQIDVIQQCLAKTGGSLAVVVSDMPHDPGQVV
jgi:hypothetical protein